MTTSRRVAISRRVRLRGQGALQYGLGLALIAVVVMVGAGAVGRTAVSSTCQITGGLSAGSGCDAAGNLLNRPGIPATAATATAGFRQATVTFAPATVDGGTPILRYDVVSTPGNITASGPSSPITVTGLTPGGVYTFSVHAVNSVGAGAPSASSQSITLANVPGVPYGVTVLGDAGATIGVSFSNPSNGGTPITSFTVTSTPGGLTASGPASPITFTGLDVSTFYTFSVVATNAAGTGSPSKASGQVKPVPPPAIPTGIIGIAGNHFITMTWDAPPGVDDYAYSVMDGCRNTSGSGVSRPSITTSSLTNGSPQTFSVSAHGPGGYSGYSQAVTATPTGPPGAPTSAGAVAAAGQAEVAFVRPYNCGGTPIMGYTVTSTPGGFSVTGTAPPLTVTGLIAGTPYTFEVVATNVNGNSTRSAPSQAVTPS